MNGPSRAASSTRRDGSPSDVLAVRLSQLWDAEQCDWKLTFEAPMYGNDGCWKLLLQWTEEGGGHDAEWTTRFWEFYALEGEGGPEAVLTQAVEFCEGLLPWRKDDA